MKPNRIQKTDLAVLGFLAFLLLATTLRAQNNYPQGSSVQNTATGGCTNADGLIEQASDLISQLQNIKPADFSAAADSANPKKMVDTLLDLQRRAQRLKYLLGDCFNDESIDSTWSMGSGPMPSKMQLIATELNYLSFVYETRFTEGDKSYLANSVPSDLEQQIAECKGVSELLAQASSFMDQYSTAAAESRITPRGVMPYYGHGKQLFDCGLALAKTGNSAAASHLYSTAAGIDNLMVMGDANVEAKLNRVLAIPAVQTQPIIIRYGPKSCRGHVWGDENYRSIDWDCQ